eukprot:1176558-Prorocentrum_minimum.AAC.2
MVITVGSSANTADQNKMLAGSAPDGTVVDDWRLARTIAEAGAWCGSGCGGDYQMSWVEFGGLDSGDPTGYDRRSKLPPSYPPLTPRPRTCLGGHGRTAQQGLACVPPPPPSARAAHPRLERGRPRLTVDPPLTPLLPHFTRSLLLGILDVHNVGNTR